MIFKNAIHLKEGKKGGETKQMEKTENKPKKKKKVVHLNPNISVIALKYT